MSRMLAGIAPWLLLVGCASSPEVYTDRDAGTDFAGYSRYAWREEPATRSPLVRQRLVSGIDAQLQAKGWRKVSEPEAEAVLAVHVASHDEQTIDTFYGDPAWVGWNWHGVQGVGGGHATTRVTTYKVGTLVIDMFDARSQRAIWRATAEGTVPETPEKINAAIDATIPRMFVGFPPPKED